MIEAVKDVLKIRTELLSSSDRFVLVVLAEHAGANLLAWPSATTIANATGLARETVQRSLKTLQDHGFIRQTGEKRNRVNVYAVRLNVIRAWHQKPSRHMESEVTEEGVVWPQITVSCEPGSQSPVSPDHTEPPLEPPVEPTTISSPPATALPAAAGAEFDAFWAAYPRKVSKAAARKAYAKARKTASAAEILEGVNRYVASDPARPVQYTAHPATWLNAARWEDDPAAIAGGSSGYGGSIRDANTGYWESGGEF